MIIDISILRNFRYTIYFRKKSFEKILTHLVPILHWRGHSRAEAFVGAFTSPCNVNPSTLSTSSHCGWSQGLKQKHWRQLPVAGFAPTLLSCLLLSSFVVGVEVYPLAPAFRLIRSPWDNRGARLCAEGLILFQLPRSPLRRLESGWGSLPCHALE